ncbi:MAG: carboxyvinyl-carboxyphosphonate phosphorylmutase [Ruminococcaceae bacterium]|nr:carboxyvinyl-carboxyphosphonate phosphorylmutase [Oscillospiraceae bacterium]
MSKGKMLKELLEKPEIIMVPGVFNPFCAILAERAGFNSVYATGYGLSADVTGYPDIGLMTMKEMSDAISNIASATKLPVIADADTGFGGPLNVVRTVKEYIKLDVAAIQIEDQQFPKRCGHMEGKAIVPASEMVARIKAADYAREGSDLLIVARTDCIAVEGIDRAIERANIYREAGADITFVEAPRSLEEMERICNEIPCPQLANMIEGGKTPFLTADELFDIGFKIVIYPLSALYAAAHVVNKVYESLKKDGTTESCRADMFGFSEFNDIVNLTGYRELENGFLK